MITAYGTRISVCRSVEAEGESFGVHAVIVGPPKLAPSFVVSMP